MTASFLGVPHVDMWIFAGLALASFLTSIFGLVAGTAGGLLLLGILAMVFPPAVLIPVHTCIQLGAGSSRVVIMRRHVMLGMLAPFAAGAAVGAAIGARIFVALPVGVLEGILGAFIILVTWMPRFGRMGPEKGRFAIVGMAATFLGMFVSATGTLVAPFIASAAPDRRNYAATFGALMSVVHTIKLIAFGLLGVAIGAYLPLVAAMVATSAAGTVVGARVLDHMPERWFRIVLQSLLTVLALRLIWVAVAKSGWL